MKQAIGSTYLINMIIGFIIIVFAFLVGTLLYFKAYKVNTYIADSLEKFEGYNKLAYDEINKRLGTMGYLTAKANKFNTDDCETRHGNDAMTNHTPKYMYCIYEIDVDDNYYKYGVQTYIQFSIPGFGIRFNVPIYSETERIYHFNEK